MSDPQGHAQQTLQGGQPQNVSTGNFQNQSPNSRSPLTLQPPKLTKEELDVLNQCSKESFWYRCVPYALVGVTLTTLAVKKGLLRPNPSVGPLYKNIAVLLTSYFLGKASYQEECKKRILELENSPLAEFLKQRDRRTSYGDPRFSDQQSSNIAYNTTDASSTGSTATSDYSSNISLDTYQNKQNQGLDDKYRPTLDRDTEPRRENTEDKYTNYEALRKQNRERYQQGYKQGVFSPSSPTEERPTVLPPVSQPSRTPGGRRNQYGDLIEE